MLDSSLFIILIALSEHACLLCSAWLSVVSAVSETIAMNNGAIWTLNTISALEFPSVASSMTRRK